MQNYETTIKQAIKTRNKNNPTLPKITLSSLANDLNTSTSQISQIGKRFTKNFNAYFNAIFDSDDKEIILKNWEKHLECNIILLNRLEKIRVILGLQIWDLIKKKQ